jgi:hypothetical protein
MSSRVYLNLFGWRGTRSSRNVFFMCGGGGGCKLQKSGNLWHSQYITCLANPRLSLSVGRSVGRSVSYSSCLLLFRSSNQSVAFATDWSLVRRSPTTCLNRLRNFLCEAAKVLTRNVEPQMNVWMNKWRHEWTNEWLVGLFIDWDTQLSCHLLTFWHTSNFTSFVWMYKWYYITCCLSLVA